MVDDSHHIGGIGNFYGGNHLITTNETFALAEAKKLIDNLEKGIYEDALRYLTGNGEHERGLSLETLKKFKVGLGSERFTNEDGVYQQFDSIYFPIYRPTSLDNNQN